MPLPALRSNEAARKSNANYQVRIVHTPLKLNSDYTQGSGNTMVLPMPENFQLNFSSSFDRPFEQGIATMFPGVGQAAKMLGGSLATQAMTVQVWQGTEPVQFNLTFELAAEENEVEEILQVMKKLTKLCLPGLAGGLLAPPGPRLDPTTFVRLIGATAAAGVLGATQLAVAGVDAITGGLINSASYQDAIAPLSEKANSLMQELTNPVNNTALHIGKFLYFPSVVISNVAHTYPTVMSERGIPIRATIDLTFTTWYIPVESDVDKMYQR